MRRAVGGSSPHRVAAGIAEASRATLLAVRDYDLAATLDSGQVFRWQAAGGRWTGVVGRRWVALRQTPEGILAETAGPGPDWSWLEEFLQTRVELEAVLAAFPDDPPMRAAVAACRGLRLLRQEPWECLASFICSSTKRITHIRQILERLCARYGEPVRVPPGETAAFAFPRATRLAALTEADLRACKAGFRAPFLLAAARAVASGELDLGALGQRPLPEARQRLLALPGVGPKIADCVLLFACGFPTAFPVDVWVGRALRELYFQHRQPQPAVLARFAETHFGPQAGYAQQYLFHYMRARRGAAPEG